MRWWYLGQYYPLFEMQSVYTSIFYILMLFSLIKIFVVKFFVGSFGAKTTRMFNNCYKSKRNFWGKCAAHQLT